MSDSEKLDLILSEMQDMKQEIGGMKQEIGDVKRKVTRMELIIENEIRVNIQRVAEAHLDLDRKLREALKPSEEMEMLSIKVRKLESGMRDLKPGFA